MQLSNHYAALPERFYERVLPATVRRPKLTLWNAALAEQLQFPPELFEDERKLAAIFGGNDRLTGSEPIAIAYAGHQFGSFVPQLGDGRAHLLGELRDRNGRLFEVQLKGSGRTPFSRGGDGRCALGPAIREFIMSEALYGLGIPTTRSLAVVQTGQPVQREMELPGAVLTRITSSHLRVGTFEYFSVRKDTEALATLLDFAVERHDPELRDLEARDKVTAFIDAVIGRQIDLATHWMRVGFIHGVMNTDNTSISGETLDFGPCAMMGIFDPATVYSSIDHLGRYAYGNQPRIAGWNLARLAETLLPLIDEDQEVAIEAVQPMINGFASRFETSWLAMMRAKLGLIGRSGRSGQSDEDDTLVTALLDRMLEKRLDYTNTFVRLADALAHEPSSRPTDELMDDLGDWLTTWMATIDAQPNARPGALERMEAQNPLVIPRNHHVEAALTAAVESGDLEPTRRFLKVLRSPYEVLGATPDYQDPPADGDRDYRTFCGT